MTEPRYHPYLFCLALFAFLWSPMVATADTIEPGQRRVVQGELSAVDQAHHSVVVEVPTANGELTVGVTMARDAEILQDGQTTSLANIPVGQSVVLEYKREGDRLVGIRLVKP